MGAGAQGANDRWKSLDRHPMHFHLISVSTRLLPGAVSADADERTSRVRGIGRKVVSFDLANQRRGSCYLQPIV